MGVNESVTRKVQEVSNRIEEEMINKSDGQEVNHSEFDTYIHRRLLLMKELLLMVPNMDVTEVGPFVKELIGQELHTTNLFPPIIPALEE